MTLSITIQKHRCTTQSSIIKNCSRDLPSKDCVSCLSKKPLGRSIFAPAFSCLEAYPKWFVHVYGLATLEFETCIEVCSNFVLFYKLFFAAIPQPEAEACLAKIQRGSTAANYWGGPSLRACFFLRFEDQKNGTFFESYCFAKISIALRPSRPASRPASKPASKPAPRCFVLMSMVSRHWSSRLALRPASNFVSSYILFVLLQFP